MMEIDAEALDSWVFDHFETFLKNRDSSLNDRLHQPGVVFFLHLLGLDTNGHAYRPYSREYLHNIKHVDSGIQKIVEDLENLFQDGKTAYIMTSDHGMSNLGAHGDGQQVNTECPFVAWGAGIRSPELVAPKQFVKEWSFEEQHRMQEWDLQSLSRRDIRQADIAPLMSVLIGKPIPVNSVGILPE